MSDQTNGLRLVPKHRPLDALHPLRKALPAQNVLFPSGGNHLLVFVTFSRLSDCEFLESLQLVCPRIIMDLRRFPRFDVGRLTRRLAFEHFEQTHTRYVDLLCSDDCASGKAEVLISSEFAASTGPIMVLLEAKQTASDLTSIFTKQFSLRSHKPWNVIELPAHLPA